MDNIEVTTSLNTEKINPKFVNISKVPDKKSKKNNLWIFLVLGLLVLTNDSKGKKK